MNAMGGRADATGTQDVVSVFGSGEVRSGEQEWDTAVAVGRKLAQLGYTIANGGYAGTMEASARGAKEGGGTVIGVTCSVWGRSANKYTDRVIVTNSLPERIQTLVELGRSGYVVLPGATGTLAELAWVWEFSCKGLLDRDSGRPIVCIGEFWRPLLGMMSPAQSGAPGLVELIESPDELERYFSVR
jgi:uncharacterized protein (TIGR00725 family)